MKPRDIVNAIKFSITEINSLGYSRTVILMSDMLRKVIFSLCMIYLPQQIVKLLLGEEMNHAFYCIVFLCFIVLCNDAASAFINKTLQISKLVIKNRLNKKISEVIISSEYEKLETQKFFDDINFSKRCIEQESVSKVYSALIEILAGIMTITGIIWLIFSINHWIFILISISVFFNVLAEIFQMKYIYDRERKSGEVDRNLYYARNELSTNKFAKDIRMYNLYEYVSGKVTCYANALCDLWSEAAIKSVKAIGWTYVVNGIQIVTVYGIIAYQCYQGEIAIDEFILYTSGIIAFGMALKDIFAAIALIATQSKYMNAIQNMIQAKEVKSLHKSSEIETPILFQQKIEFVHVCFRYVGAEYDAIHDLSLTFEKGKRYALVGQNGSGKTTLIKLLMGLYKQTSGEILVDGTPLEHMVMKQYWKLFSCVFQDFNIYGYSVKENIDFYNENSDEVAMEVLQKVGLGKKISSLPNQMNSIVNRELSSEGIMLSGGENQLLAIARAINRDAEFYILDEPTAALSPQSEMNLYQEFDRFTRGKTVAFISHRLASCKLCDEIVVLDGGMLHEMGTHSYLMNKQGLYCEMFNLQSKPYYEGRNE